LLLRVTASRRSGQTRHELVSIAAAPAPVDRDGNEEVGGEGQQERVGSSTGGRTKLQRPVARGRDAGTHTLVESDATEGAFHQFEVEPKRLLA